MALAMLLIPTLPGVAWAVRWGPPRSRWSLVEVVAAFAYFVGLAGLAGGAASLWLTGDMMPDASALVPGVLGTAHASVMVSVLVLRRARGGPLGLGGAPPWAWGAAIAAVPLFLAVSASWAWLVEALGWGFEPQHLLMALSDAPLHDRIAILGYGAVGAPLVEELLFRGFLLPPLERHAGRTSAIVAGGAAFGVVHLTDPIAVVPLVILGVGLAWLRMRSGSIWPGVAVHVTNNAIALWVGLHAG